MGPCDICGRPMWTGHGGPVCPDCDRDRRYRIVRFYRDRPGSARTIARGLTLREARAHCADPETSSSTATGPAARATTRRNGAWFDGFTDR